MAFIYDILVYSRNMGEHLQHLKITLETLKKHQLFAKLSKCQFGSIEVAYLGHLISAQGVKADLAKLKALEEWPKPHNIKTLKDFLRLTGY